MKEDKPKSKTCRDPDAPKMADPEAVKKALERAKRILLLYMPTASKLIH